MPRHYHSRRGRVSRRVARKGRRIKKKGYSKRALPSKFPPSEATQRFTSTQSTLINGHVNDASHWQVFRFSGSLAGADDRGYYADTVGDTTGDSARMATHSYRNWDLISPFYDRLYVPSTKLTLEFQSIKGADSTDLTNYLIYVWMGTHDVLASDASQPIAMPVSTTVAGLPADFHTYANTTATIAKLEHSRRVTRYQSHKVGNTSYCKIQLNIPNFSTRRGYKINVGPKTQVAGTGGNTLPPSRTIAAYNSDHYGFHNQVNVVCIAEHNDASQPAGAKHFNHLRITKSFVAHFYERNETTA